MTKISSSTAPQSTPANAPPPAGASTARPSTSIERPDAGVLASIGTSATRAQASTARRGPRAAPPKMDKAGEYIAGLIEERKGSSASELIRRAEHLEIDAVTERRERTLLHKAFKHLGEDDHLKEVVLALLDRGASLKALDVAFKTPLSVAQKYERLTPDIQQALADKGLDLPELLRQDAELRKTTFYANTLGEVGERGG